MAITQTKIRPVNLQIAGDPNTGEVWLHYQMSDNTATSIQLAPAILAETIANLVQCAATSEVRELKEVIQLFAARELHIGVLNGNVLMLTQQLECGLSVTTTLENNDAQRLQDELQTSLDFVRSHPSSPH